MTDHEETEDDRVTAPIVLSLFPGADLLGMAFELEGFCVVQGPDVQFGRDVRDFHPPAGRFDGIIGGPPCQRFSQLKRTGEIAENLIPEFERVVAEASPDWFVMENVPQAPLPFVDGYEVTQQLLNNRWLGEEQSRLRRFSFGFQKALGRATEFGHISPGEFELRTEQVALENPLKSGCFTANATQWEPGNGRRKGRSRSCRTDAEFRRGCRLQGLPETFLDESPFTVEGKIRLVGNGVPIPMGRAVARAVKRALGIAIEGVDGLEWRAFRGGYEAGKKRQSSADAARRAKFGGDRDWEKEAAEQIDEEGWPSRDRAVAYLALCMRESWIDGQHWGLHQASADAATVAGLQKKLDAWEPIIRSLEATNVVPASLRPEPGGAK